MLSEGSFLLSTLQRGKIETQNAISFIAQETVRELEIGRKAPDIQTVSILHLAIVSPLTFATSLLSNSF